ncbi:MAG: Hsp70 family protein, partial [Deltaproteobacteria bacterium]|nr:Hsp70 family protein [Deltaproteobacteria bacterium]
RIEGTGGLSGDEIDRMVNEAESHASEDKGRRESIEKKNNLDSMIYQAEKTLKESADALDEGERASLESVLADAKKDLESDDPAQIEAAYQRVETELHKVAEKMYKAQAEGATADAAGGQPEDGPQAGAEDVIDAEFTEEKDNS